MRCSILEWDNKIFFDNFFQHQYGNVGVMETDYKGRGLKAEEDLEA